MNYMYCNQKKQEGEMGISELVLENGSFWPEKGNHFSGYNNDKILKKGTELGKYNCNVAYILTRSL